MHSVFVVLEQKQEAKVLYFFSGDISHLVIQVLKTVSHSKKKVTKTVLFSLQRVAFFREENLLQVPPTDC